MRHLRATLRQCVRLRLFECGALRESAAGVRQMLSARASALRLLRTRAFALRRVCGSVQNTCGMVRGSLCDDSKINLMFRLIRSPRRLSNCNNS